MADDIVITGMGVMSPIGCNVEAFWEGLRTGRCGVGKVDSLDTRDLIRDTACQVREPVPHRGIESRAAALAATAAEQAVADARLSAEDRASAQGMVVVGTTMGETQFIEGPLFQPDEDEWLSSAQMRRVVGAGPGCISESVKKRIGLSGTAGDLYGACAAGNMALTMARQKLSDGRCDLVLAGGSDGFSRLAFIGFMRLRVMSAGVCRPFDEKRDGLLVGEGAAMFVLERESHARARGARIRARLLGGSMTSESYHPTRPEPNGDGLTRAISQALAQAGLSAKDISYVNAHGTGTPQNDAIEVVVLNKCFPSGVPFSSIKAVTGHCMGAAAALEAACCILSLESQQLVPTWHLENVLRPCEGDAVMGKVRNARLTFAMNNSAGFGGYNSSVILGAA